jgi:PAS domain S-box-containing protein
MKLSARYIPLQRKIGLAILATVILMGLVFGLVMGLLQKAHTRSAVRQSEQYLKMLVERDAEPLANELFEKRLRALDLRIREILSLEGLLAVTLYDPGGAFLIHLDRAERKVPEAEKMKMDPSDAPKTAMSAWEGIPALVHEAPIMAMGEAIGVIRLVYSMAEAERQRRFFYLAAGVLLAAAFLLMLVVLNRLLSTTVSRPIQALNEAMKRIESEGPGEGVPTASKDEIGDLIRAFNRMSRQLREMLNTVHIEVFERKQAEEEMQRLRNYLANIIDSMPSVLVGVDGDGRVTQWNQSAEKRTGIRVQEAKGRPMERVLPMLGRDIAKVRRAIQDREVQAENKVARSVDGETRFEDITVYPLVTDGVEGAVIRVDDVTERVRLEEMMVQSEKMLSVGGLAAGMAHEINNPLGVILQAAQNVLRRISPCLAENERVAKECGTTLQAIRDYLEKREIGVFLQDIRQSGERAAGIVSNMLSFSRKADGPGSSTDLRDLLDRSVALAGSDFDLKKKHDFKQIEIVREYEAGLPLVVCHPSKIQQVFLNILRNGAEAMNEQGSREMESGAKGERPRLTLRIMRDGEMVRVEIGDNGPGMDEATRKRVFEPFFTTKAPGVGTGLGLPVSYFIIQEEHGGTITVESTPGAGARFIIRLTAQRGGKTDTSGGRVTP